MPAKLVHDVLVKVSVGDKVRDAHEENPLFPAPLILPRVLANLIDEIIRLPMKTWCEFGVLGSIVLECHPPTQRSIGIWGETIQFQVPSRDRIYQPIGSDLVKGCAVDSLEYGTASVLMPAEFSRSRR